MKILLNGCHRSEISVTPTNWNTKKASIKKTWKIHYRFYDPAFKDHPKYKGGIKQVIIKGMNGFHTLEERQAVTQGLINTETDLIDVKGYNPISGTFMAPVEDVTNNEGTTIEGSLLDVKPETPLIKALERTLLSCLSAEAIPLMIDQGYTFKTDNYTILAYKDGQLLSDQSGNPLPLIDLMTEFVREKKLSSEMEPETITDCKSVLKYFSKSTAMLRKDMVPLKDIKSKDLKAILDNCKNLKVEKLVNKKVQVNGKWVVEKQIVDGKSVPVKVISYQDKVWNDNQFNHFRAYLRILYTKIKKQEVIDYNPIDNIDIIDTTPEDPDQQQRKVLTDEQRKRIHEYTKERFPEFNRIIHIFYHSGGRRKEIMRVQGKQVDLAGQRFKVLVKKRKKWTWVWKTIKDMALPYWIEAVENCGPEDFVFSVGLKPGPSPIRPEQVTRRWRRHIKKALDIDSRFYDLKHLHTTELIDIITDEIEKEAIREAANHNSHTSDAMVINIYDVKQEKRKHNKVKKAANSFV